MGNKSVVVKVASMKSFFLGKPPEEAIESLVAELHACDVRVGDPTLVTVGKDTYVSVKAELVVEDGTAELVIGHDVKFVRVKADLDEAYVAAKAGVIARIFEGLGCIKATSTEPSPEQKPAEEKVKRPRKAKAVKESEESAEAVKGEASCEPEAITASEAPEKSEQGKEPNSHPEIAENSDKAETTTEPVQIIPVAKEPEHIEVTLITAFTLNENDLSAKGKIGDRTVEVSVPKERFGIIKRSESINCFLKRKVPGTVMSFKGWFEGDGDSVKVVFMCYEAKTEAAA